jgi:predicted ester cyclase
MAALRALYRDDASIRDPDGVYDDPETYLAHLAEQLAPLSDLTYTIVRLHGGADCAVAEWTLTGTNSGPATLPDGTSLPPTGRTITLPVLTLFEVRDGRIAVERSYWDNAAIFAQLGLMPKSAP